LDATLKWRCKEYGIRRREAALKPPVLESILQQFYTTADDDTVIATRLTVFSSAGQRCPPISRLAPAEQPWTSSDNNVMITRSQLPIQSEATSLVAVQDADYGE
jgi:hypothetical protein